jgi:hypothetical protein
MTTSLELGENPFAWAVTTVKAKRKFFAIAKCRGPFQMINAIKINIYLRM